MFQTKIGKWIDRSFNSNLLIFVLFTFNKEEIEKRKQKEGKRKKLKAIFLFPLFFFSFYIQPRNL